jgi:hypothetical protein
MTRTLALASILVLLCGLGCSSFKSSSSPSRWSGQSSKASSSPSRWSSQSSGGGNEAPGDSTAYEKDVRAAAAEAARGGAGGHEVMRRVGIVAADHGITDWEGNPATYRAIGAGLASGGLPVNDFEQISRDISAGSETRSKLLLEGYSSSP